MLRRNFIQTSLVAVPLVSLSTLTEAGIKPAIQSFIVKGGEDRFNEPILYRGINPNLVKISGKDTGGQLAIFEYIGLEKMGPPMHVHYKQDEIFYVVEGEYLFQVGEEQHRLKEGDTIFLPRNIPHTWLQLSDKGKLTYQVQPAGKMEEFFKQMNAIEGIPTEDQIRKVHLAHDLKVLGPPLSL
ncbi:cupin domain-containing protein [Rhodocytophaga rosea]|uniref:Cupin domain-containing protein n=1 Tax=Rhodocytophaga rosea TaxID=2704465 RepID=A0A6C0GTA8_9BACT|nr:cupin domain-containing protein [Rhodocytophaga rosea]QHT70700.1 cupin domain-containing protein [Rhodocytophaga rosea]